LLKPVYLGNTGFVLQAGTRAADKDTPSYQQYLIMSRNECGQGVLDIFRFGAYRWTVLEKRAKGTTNPITNYDAFVDSYYRIHDDEHKKHRSITIGFRAEKTIPDLTGNTSKDTYWAGLQFYNLASTFALVNVNIDDVYDCLQMAKPVSILPGEGIDMTCDYAKCVGEEVKIGY